MVIEDLSQGYVATYHQSAVVEDVKYSTASDSPLMACISPTRILHDGDAPESFRICKSHATEE